jgi:tRNA-dihydrouridine synthase A
MLNRTLSVAPMMGCTDRHCRYLLRLISPNSLLYTEMVVTGALIHGNAQHFLAHEGDAPCAIQLGGSDPTELAQSARMAEDAGYQELNLNVGCPSDRVQYGGIGACLMAQPQLVADCVSAMRAVVDIPVTVKSRIGIDDEDSFESFERFIDVVRQGGCDTFIVHARKAILTGLSPKENREIPPLKYNYVYDIKQRFPDMTFILNGGLKDVDTTLDELNRVDGVMLGRAPYSNPWLLAELEAAIFDTPLPDRFEVLAQYRDYMDHNIAEGQHFKHMAQHLLGLFSGCRGARAFRRHMSENMFREDANCEIIDNALAVSGLTRDDTQVQLERTGT